MQLQKKGSNARKCITGSEIGGLLTTVTSKSAPKKWFITSELTGKSWLKDNFPFKQGKE